MVQKNGEEFTFLTNEEQEAELRIQHYNIDMGDIVDYVAEIAFEEVIGFPNNKYRYSPRYQFGFNQLIDDKVYRSNAANRVGLRLFTAYSRLSYKDAKCHRKRLKKCRIHHKHHYSSGG